MSTYTTPAALRTATGAILAVVVAACATAGPASPATSGPAASPAITTTPQASTSEPPASASPSPLVAASPSASADPVFDPAAFPDGATVTNPWFPLTPGTTFTSRGTKDGEAAVDRFTVSDRTKVIAGVTTRIVPDRLTLSGILHERTTDYYAQDQAGNVWYLGEDTAELDAHGKVLNRDGTWHAGVDGAIPGIYMEAEPVVGHAYRQEFYPGEAEDHFEVISLTATVHVPFGDFQNALRTKEWTPLEPDVLDNKFYVRGVGQVREVSVKGAKEQLELVKVEHR
jgi:hypothetical protein